MAEPKGTIPLRFLHQKYVVEKLSIAQISSQIVSSKPTIRKALREAGISLRRAHQHHGRTEQLAYGFKRRADKVSTHLSEHRVIRAIQGLDAQGLSLRQIAKFLSQTGVPTKNRGVKWHPMMVSRILKRSSNISAQEPPKGEDQSSQESIASSSAQDFHSSKASDRGSLD